MKKIIIYSALLTFVGLGSAMIYKNYKGIDETAIDKTVVPGEDFYRYANGSWLKNNPVMRHLKVRPRHNSLLFFL